MTPTEQEGYEEAEAYSHALDEDDDGPNVETLLSQDSSSSQSGDSRPASRKRSRSDSRPMTPVVEDTLIELRRIADRGQPVAGNEYDSFCESLAIQLKLMPPECALRCQARLQKVMTLERMAQLSSEEPPCICGARSPETP